MNRPFVLLIYRRWSLQELKWRAADLSFLMEKKMGNYIFLHLTLKTVSEHSVSRVQPTPKSNQKRIYGSIISADLFEIFTDVQ